LTKIKKKSSTFHFGASSLGVDYSSGTIRRRRRRRRREEEEEEDEEESPPKPKVDSEAHDH